MEEGEVGGQMLLLEFCLSSIQFETASHSWLSFTKKRRKNNLGTTCNMVPNVFYHIQDSIAFYH